MTSEVQSRNIRFAPPTNGRVDLLVVAGEHSGDEHAARLVRELRRQRPDWSVAALGGPELAAAGAQLLHDLTSSSVVGIVEVLRNYPFFRRLFEETLRWIAEFKPRAVCFVDYPGFNLRVASALKARRLSVKGGGSIATLYYISPQIWAWKAGRRFAMARTLDAMAVIFPFEVACYADTSLPVEFVGHPFVSDDYVPPVRYDASGEVLLLPGSRTQAVARIFPVLLRGFAQSGLPEAVVIYPSNEIRDVLRAAGPPGNVRLAPTGEVVAASAVLTSSGTMSMHCALAGIPGAIAYAANPFTYWLGRRLVKVEYIGIANLLLREPMYPEFIQGTATPSALADQLRRCTQDEARRIRTRDQSLRLRAILAQPAGASAATWLARRMQR